MEAKPKAALWRTTPYPNYEKMMILYRVDRANRDDGETVCKWLKRRFTEEDNETMNDFDNIDSQDRFTTNNVDIDGQGESPEQDNSPTAIDSVSSKRTKRVHKADDNNLKDLTRAICTVAEALIKGNNLILQGNTFLQKIANTKLPVPQLSGEEVWQMLQECGCDAAKIHGIYWFLMSDVNRLRAVVQCPSSARKQLIITMMHSSH